MALKNLYDMVKADRYTADGREALIKAQEAETEDAKEKPEGSISPDGKRIKQGGKWVPRKNEKQPGAKKAEGTAESKPGRDHPALKKEDHVKLAKEVLSNTSATDPGWTAEEIAKEWKLGKADAEEVKKEFDNLRKGSSGNKPAESKPSAGNNPGNTSWKEAKVGLINQAGVPLSLNNITFGMTPAWAKNHGYSPEDVNGTAAEVKLAKQIITNQDWSNPEEAVKKINDMDFGYTNWKVTKKESDKVKIASKDSLGNLRELTIKRQPTGDSAPRVLTGDTRIRVRKA